MENAQERSNTVIKDVSGDATPDIMQISSMCVRCENQGVTRLFLTKIPYFREVIVSSFSCSHCGETNSELQPAATIKDKGVKYVLAIGSMKDLSRQVVISSTASLSIPELEFEIPPHKSSLTTVEGIILKAMEGLGQDQKLRQVQHPELADKIEAFTESLGALKDGRRPFTLIVDDISGNSFVENPSAPEADPHLTVSHYVRSAQQDEALGIVNNSASADDDVDVRNEVLHIDSQCPLCQAACPVNMKVLDIPHFKEVIIMATTCDACGYRSNEAKAGAGVSPRGCRIRLTVDSRDDLKRDVLKSETASVRIPELEFETDSLGGKFTTVEGILTNIRDSLKELDPFTFGDSSEPEKRIKLNEFCAKLNQIIDGTYLGVHLELDDPAGNSFIQNQLAPEADPLLDIVHYDRTFEQNEELGLNDMKTENYDHQQ